MGRKKNRCPHNSQHPEVVWFRDDTPHVQLKCDHCGAGLGFEPRDHYDLAELPQGETRAARKRRNKAAMMAWQNGEVGNSLTPEEKRGQAGQRVTDHLA